MYGFVVLTGDMIFKDLLVGMKLLLRHERLSGTSNNDDFVVGSPAAVA